jgi:hypothetical protein
LFTCPSSMCTPLPLCSSISNTLLWDSSK